MKSERTVRIILVGAGNLGRRFAQVATDKHDELLRRYALDIRIIGIADSRGAAVCATGLDGHAIATIKESGGSVGDLPAVGRPGMTGLELIDLFAHDGTAIGDGGCVAAGSGAAADILCEAGPVNLGAGGEPGLSHVRRALELGMHVSTPNKGPIVLAYRELMSLALEHCVQLHFDGTVAGGLPAIALGARDLRGTTIHRIESVPNLTTGFVLDRLAAGMSWDNAVEEARAAGALEGDGVWDLDGWDAAAKLTILALSVLDLDIDLNDVPRKGIRDIDREWLKTTSQHALVRLLASAIRQPDGSYQLDVAPRALPRQHPLGQLESTQMGISYETDLFGTITSTIDEQNPLPSAASMLRDILSTFAVG